VFHGCMLIYHHSTATSLTERYYTGKRFPELTGKL